MPNKSENLTWSQEIKPKKNLLDVNLKEIIRYKDLIEMFVRRDFVSQYKQTILGPIWFFLQPIFTTLIFTVVFGRLAGISTDGVPQILFYLSGITLWNYFADCLKKTSNTFIDNQTIFGKVYFHRLTIPISVIISNLLKLFIQLALFFGFLTYFLIQGADVQITWQAALLPLLIIIMAGLGLGLGIIFTSLTTKYRDLRFLLEFGIQLAMYVTPIIYPLSSIPENMQKIALLNPIAPIIETFKVGFLGAGHFSWFYLGYSFVFMVVVLLLGVIIFNRTEQNFMDTV